MRTFPSEHRIWEQAEYQWTSGCFFLCLSSSLSKRINMVVSSSHSTCFHIRSVACIRLLLISTFRRTSRWCAELRQQALTSAYAVPLRTQAPFLQAEGSNQWHLPIRQQKNLLSACAARISSSYHDPSPFTQCCLCRPSA